MLCITYDSASITVLRASGHTFSHYWYVLGSAAKAQHASMKPEALYVSSKGSIDTELQIGI